MLKLLTSSNKALIDHKTDSKIFMKVLSHGRQDFEFRSHIKINCLIKNALYVSHKELKSNLNFGFSAKQLIYS